KNYSTAFIWWARAAENFASIKEKSLTQIALKAAKTVVENIQSRTELSTQVIGEYQEIFSKIDDTIYKIEKDLLDKAVKDVLVKKSGTP
ncbi:MAG: hypothetical protein Q7S79_03705, partial [bacterium]|nr:hypothetical protein [bacterium]